MLATQPNPRVKDAERWVLATQSNPRVKDSERWVLAIAFEGFIGVGACNVYPA